jgi:hypothetical protein
MPLRTYPAARISGAEPNLPATLANDSHYVRTVSDADLKEAAESFAMPTAELPQLG